MCVCVCVCVCITETFYRHPYIIYTSLYFERFIYIKLILPTTHFFVVFSNVHLKQISHRKVIKSFIQSHICFIFSKWSGGAMVLG